MPYVTAPSHYLNQCWLLVSEVFWHSPDSNFTTSAQAINLYNMLENDTFKIIPTSPNGQWVKPGTIGSVNQWYYVIMLMSSNWSRQAHIPSLCGEETSGLAWVAQSISHKICTWFCCAVFCCGYIIVLSRFAWFIYPCHSGLLHWH